MNDILTVSEHQEIYVSKERDIEKNTISYDDRELLFDVKYTDKKGNKRYIISNDGKNKIKAKSIVGSISLKTGLTVEILPKFAKNDLNEESIKRHRKMLLNILRVSNERNFISSSSQSSKILADEMPLLHYVIELFSIDLLHTLRTGIYATYNKKIENSSHIRGNILISKTLQNNIIDKSKVYISYNKYSSNNLLMQVFRTLAKILLNDNNISYKAKQTLHEVYLLLDGVDIIPLKKQDFKSMTFNRLNDKFETLFRQAEFIFNRYMPFSSHINSTPFWAILFDMNYIFEKFCTYLFRKSDLEIEEQSIFNCFENTHIDKIVSAKPDFVLSQDNNIIVADAKWKLLSKDKPIYGLDAQNFWQLFSYMNLLNNEKELHGYFIVPKNSNDFEDEIIFNPIKEGNKTITILSIDFSLGFEELIERYMFEIVNNELKILKTFNKIKIVNELEEEFKKIIKKHNENKKNYIRGITEEDFINEYPSLSTLLSQLSDDSFKNDKYFYLNDFAKLSKNSIRIIFETMRKDEEKGIDFDLIYDFILKTPHTRLSKQNKKKKHKSKSWKNKSLNIVENKNIIEKLISSETNIDIPKKDNDLSKYIKPASIK